MLVQTSQLVEDLGNSGTIRNAVEFLHSWKLFAPSQPGDPHHLDVSITGASCPSSLKFHDFLGTHTTIHAIFLTSFYFSTMEQIMVTPCAVQHLYLILPVHLLQWP